MNAKTGGAATSEEQKKCGGKPDECMIYELCLYHLLEDDTELKTMYETCKQGKLLCGVCKKRTAELMEHLLTDLQKKRTTATQKIQEYLH